MLIRSYCFLGTWEGVVLFSASVVLALFLLRAKVLSVEREFIPLQSALMKKPLPSNTKSSATPPPASPPHNSAP